MLPTLNTLVQIEDKPHPGSTALSNSYKAVLFEKLKRAQSSEPVKFEVPSMGFLQKNYDFPIIFLRRDKQDQPSASAEAESVNLCLAEYGTHPTAG